MTFIDGVILFENQRLPGFETDKSDMEFIKLLDAASKVYFQIITVDHDCIMRLIFDVKIISDSALTESKMDSDELALTELIGKQFGLPPPENNSDPGLVEKWRQAAKQIIRSTVSLYTTVTKVNFLRVFMFYDYI